MNRPHHPSLCLPTYKTAGDDCGLASAAWPFAAHVQQQRRGPIVGFLTTRSQEEAIDHRAAFLRGLERGGYVEDRNVYLEYRWAGGRNERLGAFAAELARLPVSVLVTGGDPSAAAAKAVAGSIPIVFMIAEDPVRAGLVASLNHPQGNATGISLITSALGSKRLDVVREMVPAANPVALSPDNPSADGHAEEVRAAAQALGRRLIVLQSRSALNFATASRLFARSELARSSSRGILFSTVSVTRSLRSLGSIAFRRSTTSANSLRRWVRELRTQPR